MADRAWVSLYVPTALKHKAMRIAQKSGESGTLLNEDKVFACIGFEDVNAGELEFLDELLEAGIAYDSDWCSGDEFGPGSHICRFTPEGDAILKTLWDQDASPRMCDLMQRIDDPVALRQFILDHQAERSYPGWENQVLYGKLYRAKQLIVPK